MGNDVFLVPKSLADFVAEADIFEMSEVRAYIALPNFLKSIPEDQFDSVRGSSRAFERGVN